MNYKYPFVMESFKTVNDVPTKMLMIGKHIDEDLEEVQYLVLVFPGNPGVVEYYREFLTELYSRLVDKFPDVKIPVWGISHAGHQMDDLDDKLFPKLEGNEHLYSLNGQILHKFEFIKRYIPKHIKVIGVGHSIGCKLWSEVLKMADYENNEESLQIVKCFMLFPTLERMRNTPNGKSFTAILPFYSFYEPFLKLAMMLPTLIHRIFLSVYFWRKNVPPNITKASLQLFMADVFQRVFYMARCEMESVWNLDVETLRKNLEKLYFYFGSADGWVPVQFIDEMLISLPEMRYSVCDQGIEHAFVISHSSQMAEKICSVLDITVP